MVLVFKTSKNMQEIKQITPKLNRLLKKGNWNFDINDCDNILRVVSTKNVTNNVIKALHLQGFNCEELQ